MITLPAQFSKFGRKPVYIFEIDMPKCSLTYGTTPCAAALGVTGSDRCYNTFATCQDPANFTPTTVTYRWSNVVIKDPSLFPCVPGISSIQHAPTKIEPGKGIGARANATIVINDTPMSDYGIDNYVATRSYDSLKQGTFWGKWLARNKFYPNRVCRLKFGFLDDDGSYNPANFITYTYMVDAIDWTNNSQSVQITVKDLLKLADDAKAICPPITGASLVADIATTGTSFVLQPAGIVAEMFGTTGATGWLIIDNEVMAWTVSATPDTLTVVRAQYNTTAATHTAGTKVQICVAYVNRTISDVIYDLLTTYGNVPTGYITKSDWDAETATWLDSVKINALLCQPDGVTKLLDDLCAHGICYIWWDEVAATLRFKAVRPATADEQTPLSDSNFIAGMTTVATKSRDRINTVLIYYNIYDRTKNSSSSSNYQSSYAISDLDSGSTNEYQTNAITVIFSRWINDDDTAIQMAARMLSRYKDNLIQVTFAVDAKDAVLWTGDSVIISSRFFQGPSGAVNPTDADIIQCQQVGEQFQYIALVSNYQGSFGLYTDDSAPDYIDSNSSERSHNAFFTSDTGLEPDGSQGTQWS